MPLPERGTGTTQVARRDGGGVAFALTAVCSREVAVGLETAISKVIGSGVMAW
jgi:hypothetical protein